MMPVLSRRMTLSGLFSALLSAGLLKAGVSSAQPATIKPDGQSVLLVIDVQNCFLPGGSLAVKDGEKIIPIINALEKQFTNIVFTQDWHTPGHVSFASSHEGKKPYDLIDLPYGKQVLWPDHCVQGTDSAKLDKDLDTSRSQLILHKGYHPDVDSYSAFVEGDKKTETGLTSYFKERGIKKVYIVGLATDFCVAWSAMDARNAGFEVWVIEDATRGIDVGGSLAAAWAGMEKAGVKRVQSSDFLA